MQEIGQKAIALQADLADPDQVDAITADMLGFAGRVDILIGFTRALATDPAPFGITVNAVCPTASSTPGGKAFVGDEVLEMVAGMQAIKRVGTAADGRSALRSATTALALG